MTETKLPGWAINKIDSKETYDKLVEAGEIGENDLCLVEGDDVIVVAPSAEATTGQAADAKSVWDLLGDVVSLINAI